MTRAIEVRGADTHNLKHVDIDVPKHQVVVFTGVSGSGKSSLVFDTIYTEAQRQLVETFSTYARRRLPQLSRPPVDVIHNISPCIVIDQKRLGASSRSTVGTATEVYTYLRMLFSRAGRPFIGWSHRFSFNHPEGMCPSCKGLGKRLTVDIDRLLDRSRTIEEGAIRHPDYDIGKWYYREILWSGVVPADVPLNELSDELMERLLWADKYPISYDDRGKTHQRTFTGVARKLEQLHIDKDEDQISANRLKAYRELFRAAICPACEGLRLNSEARAVRLADGSRIADLVDRELTDLHGMLGDLHRRPEYAQIRPAVKTLTDKMRSSLRHLIEIGVGYLSLNRSVNTLSGGESQRVKMARQLDCDLVDLIYILDEPSVGLHARDIDHLVAMLGGLRDAGNSVLVVEHDAAVIRAADWIVDIGPHAGELGGRVLHSGTLESLLSTTTPTARALAVGTAPEPRARRPWSQVVHVADADRNNLKSVTVDVPKGVFTCLTGVAGSGKSSLVADYVAGARALGERIVVIDQKPVGRSSRSNPATYIGVFDHIRRGYAEANNVSPSLFSFNSAGSCPECGGRGYIEMELSFLEDVQLECSTCHGRRYRDDVLEYRYHGKSIDGLLELTVVEATTFLSPFASAGREAKILRGLEVLTDVGVGYLRLGQPLSTLSGGEAQRLKLAAELTKSGNTYVMDEPTTGLHPSDIATLLGIVDRLVDAGNSVVVIEHNLDVIAAADWIIDLGPEGGRNGGRLVAEGTPETVAATRASVTGRYLRDRSDVGPPGTNGRPAPPR